MPQSYLSAAALRRCITLVIGLAASALLPAQTAPAVSPTAPTTNSKTEAVLLTPFQVSTDKDRGYAAGNTLSGGRADTPLAITPASISVMTKEFLEDFDLTDMNQAAAWTLNMDPPTGGESGPFGGSRFQANFRGAGNGANFPSRNGALQYFIADSYNSERFEFSRGPSTTLFGPSRADPRLPRQDAARRAARARAARDHQCAHRGRRRGARRCLRPPARR